MRKQLHRAFGKASRLIYQPPLGVIDPQTIRTRDWFMINGDRTRRLDYPLKSKSVVFDLGGYEGQWASDIVGRFNCQVYVFEPMPSYAKAITARFVGNSRVKVFPFGLAGTEQTINLSIDEASSSAFKTNAPTIESPLKNASEFIRDHKIEQIDLLKINIEGGEYELLEKLIKNGDISKIVDLQIQFHDFAPKADQRMEAIQKKLQKTHFLTYQYPYVWDNWRRRDKFKSTVENPSVSVVMAVYNGALYLKTAIQSVLDQSLPDFELIVINDGSTDDTEKIIKSFSDPRIVYIKQSNQGLGAALNTGIAKAKGKYIARMDADDISLPLRLQSQFDYLGAHPDIALVGTSYQVINEQGKASEIFTGLNQPDDVYEEFLVRNPFGHGTAMFRRDVLDEVGNYDEARDAIEDYDLWWRIAKKYQVSNVSDVLYQWRVVKTGMSHSGSEQRQQPILSVLETIWNQNQPAKLSASIIKHRYHFYLQQLPEETAARLADQYIHNQYAIGLAMIAKKQRQAGLARIAAAGKAVPSSAHIASDLYYLNRSMRGYNLPLLLKDLQLAGRKIRGGLRRIKKEMPI